MTENSSANVTDFDRVVPPETLLLHTPWVRKGGEFVGLIDDPGNFVQCTHENELDGKTPPMMVDQFLTWAVQETVFNETNSLDFGEHMHDLTHSHDFGTASMTGGVSKLDADNSGNYGTVAAEHHGHQIELAEEILKVVGVDRQERPIINEPPHQEVNAYYIPKTQEHIIGIPVGTLAFYLGEPRDFNKWRPVYTRAFEGQPSEWQDVLLKIVGCWPSQRKKGSASHVHDDASHGHDAGAANASKGSARVDSSDRNDGRVASAAHTHPLEKQDIGLANTSTTGSGDSRPYNIALTVFVCEEEGAHWQYDMLAPFVPKDRSTFSSVPENWRNAERQADPDHPLYLRCTHPEFENPLDLSEPLHKHEYLHGHSLVLGQAAGGRSEQSKNEVNCAPHKHTHDITLMDATPIVSSAAPIVLYNREVSFLRYIGD